MTYTRHIEHGYDLTEELACALQYGAFREDADDLAKSLEHIAYHVSSPEGGGSIDIRYVGKTPTGSFIALEAWADYTGWGCQDGADLVERETFDEVVRDGVTMEAAGILGITKTLGVKP